MSPIVNPTLPTPGQANATEDPDLRNALIAIRDAMNGGLDATNLLAGAITDAKRLSPNNNLWLPEDDVGSSIAVEGSAGNFLLGYLHGQVSGFGAGAEIPTFWPDPAVVIPAGKTLERRLVVTLAGNATRPGCNLTIGLTRIASVVAPGTINRDPSPVASIAFGNPLANLIQRRTVTLPALSTADQYVYSLSTDGAIAVGCLIGVHCAVEYRFV
jgi:hypothetical protein